MLKPVHIVPTRVKLPDGRYETRDVLMPGIADYRIKAARSGEYGGKTEPEFGPDVSEMLGGKMTTYPAWCRITVKRIVQGQAREFTATERWLENYATAKHDSTAPNYMWGKRPYGQLAKVAESQALRMAFPEFSSGYTAEEMEGKTLDGFTGPTIDATTEASSAREAINEAVPLRAAAAATPRAPSVAAPRQTFDDPLLEPDGRKWMANLRAALEAATSREEVEAIGAHETVGNAILNAPPVIKRDISALLAQHYARFAEPEEEPEDDFPGDLPDLEIAGADKVAAG
jgi:phage recombination protein Bet